jgi:hypothetical protein
VPQIIEKLEGMVGELDSRSNAKHYKSATITEVKEFEGPHLLPAWPGWEGVADYALDWAVEHAVTPSAA